MMTVDTAQFALIDAAPRLLAALCDEVEALRAERDARAAADCQRARQRERIEAGDRRDWHTLDRLDREDEERAAKGEG